MRSRSLATVLAALAVLLSGFVLRAPAAEAVTTTKNPVIIVPGMIGVGPLFATSYIPLQLKLQSKGYDTSIFVAEDYGLGDIHANAERLGAFIDGIMDRTGATKVDVVAHSQGGLLARDYIRTLGGHATVRQLTTMATTNNGTQLANLANFFGAATIGLAGIEQQAVGSAFLTDLNAGDQSVGAVTYTNIATRYDEVVVPYTSSFMRVADGNISNHTLQDQCPLRFPEHLAIIANGAVIDGVLDTLRGEPVRFNCWAVL